MKKYLILIVLLLVTPVLWSQNTEAEPLSSAMLIQWLTPVIVYGVTWLVRQVMKFIPGWATLFIVSALSTAVSWISTLLETGDFTFIQQTLYGLLAVVIHQFYKQFKAE